MKRFWISWYWTSTSRNYPNAKFRFWHSGTRGSDNASVICAIVDAIDETEAWKVVGHHFRKHEQRFCDEKPLEWNPGDRFQ